MQPRVPVLVARACPVLFRAFDAEVAAGVVLFQVFSPSPLVSVCTQKITYDEFLPALLGHKLDPYPGYDDSVDPRVSTEFATSGYRLGHSMVAADIDFFDDFANPLFPVSALRTAEHAHLHTVLYRSDSRSFGVCLWLRACVCCAGAVAASAAPLPEGQLLPHAIVA